MWGFRRAGKTFLLSNFASGKRSVWFGAMQEAEAVEMARLAKAVGRQLASDAPHVTGESFADWHAALRFFADAATESPTLVVIDEVAALLRSHPGFFETVRSVWGKMAPGRRLMLVLIGTLRPDALLDAPPASVGRWAPTPMHLQPLDASRARCFLPLLRPPDFLEAYAACGGYPLHLRQWEQDATTEENLIRLAGTTGGLLIDDAEAMLREVLPDNGGYMRILAAIGRVQTRYSEIVVAVDQRIDHALEVLVRAGIVRRSVPVGAGSTANATDYEIVDTYLGFWFRVLYSNIPDIDAGHAAAALRFAQPAWDRHLACTFQDIARSHARRMMERGELPSDLELGRWWSATNRDAAVDVLGLHEGRSVLLGDARWSREPLTLADLARLRQNVRIVPRPVPEPAFALWGAHGVAAEVRPHALAFDVAAAVEG